MAENRGEVERERVMVAIDESDSSYYALTWVLDNLKDSIADSPLVIFAPKQTPIYNSVCNSSLSTARIYFQASNTPDFVNSVQERETKVTLGLLEKAKSICASGGVDAEIVTGDGDPKVAICDAVEKLNITLLVLGNHEMGIVKRTFVWSVSSYCVQNAKCPVLVVKKPE